MTNAEVNRIIAECVGDEGFHPARTCPRGHLTERVFVPTAGSVCGLCVAEMASRKFRPSGEEPSYEEWDAEIAILNANPEQDWIIQRGEPKDFCGSLDLTVAAMRGKFSLTLEIDDDGYTYGYIYEPRNDEDPFAYHRDDSPSVAVAHALAEAIMEANGKVGSE
ncbi:MAG: hypothetical protein ACYCOR_10585 [Acidobacteriaceae bacterium]